MVCGHILFFSSSSFFFFFFFFGSGTARNLFILAIVRVYTFSAFFDLFFSFKKKVQYNKYNTIIQHISTPVPTVDNIRIQIYMLMLYRHNRQKGYIHTDIHTDKELDKVLHRQILALHKE